MSSRNGVDVILVCEDVQHEVFARRFLEKIRKGLKVRVYKSPLGRGSGEAWVRQRYALEVNALRAANYIRNRALIVMIDEDTSATAPRVMKLAQALEEGGHDPRSEDEAIVHVIPARNIETWIAYLQGQGVDEVNEYPKAKPPHRCDRETTELVNMCREGELREPAPPSLERACKEFQSRFPDGR